MQECLDPTVWGGSGQVLLFEEAVGSQLLLEFFADTLISQRKSVKNELSLPRECFRALVQSNSGYLGDCDSLNACGYEFGHLLVKLWRSSSTASASSRSVTQLYFRQCLQI